MSKNDIAALMNGIMKDPSYQQIFAKPTPQFTKTAAKKDDKECDKKDLKCKEEKAKKLKKEKEEKAKKDEKAKKKAMSQYEICVRGLANISAALDNAGFEKAATFALLSLDSLVASASEDTDDCATRFTIGKAPSDNSPASDKPSKSKKSEKDDDKKEDEDEEKEDDEKEDKDEDEEKEDEDDADDVESYSEIQDKPELALLLEKFDHPEIQDEELIHPEIQDILEPNHPEIQDEEFSHPEIQDELDREEDPLSDEAIQELLDRIEAGNFETGKNDADDCTVCNKPSCESGEECLDDPTPEKSASKTTSSLLKLAKELEASKGFFR